MEELVMKSSSSKFFIHSLIRRPHYTLLATTLGVGLAAIGTTQFAEAHGGHGHDDEAPPISIPGGEDVIVQSDLNLFPKMVAVGGVAGQAGVSHKAIDWVAIDPEAERLLYEKVKREGIGYNKEDEFLSGARAAQAVVDPGQKGKWEGPFDWPVVAVHATLLPNGRVLAYDSVGTRPTETYQQHTFTRATVWNPANNSHASVNTTTGFNVFCSGLTILNDGRVFLAGGNLNSALDGIRQTHIFNPSNNTWSIEGTMRSPRWYPSLTMLFNREVLISGGGPTLPEVRQTNGNLRALTGANANIAADRVYHWLKQAPDGRVAYLGPAPQVRYLTTTGQGRWADSIYRDVTYRSYGSHVMYNLGRVMVSGGGTRNASTVLVNLNNNTAEPTSNMNRQRLQHNLTVLPDGQVLATGGMQNTDQLLVDVNKGVYAAETWNPANGRWTLLSSMKVTRQYHSIALLLPDGRVLSGGGGICDACQQQSYLAKNAEIFSPPYLFKKDGSGQLAARPNISNAPNNLNYNQAFNITSGQANSISKVALVRFGGVTHSVNMDQLYVPLSFTKSGNTITATPPSNSKAAPPGHYMLFILNNQGVPSIAKILKLD
jgi:hypothetical protein